MRPNLKTITQSAKNLAYVLIMFLAATDIAKPQISQQGSEEARIERVLSRLRPPIAIKGQPAVRWTLGEEMAQSQVPGISIAVITVRLLGHEDLGSKKPVQPIP